MRQKLTLIILVSLLLGAVLSVHSVAWSFEKQTPSRIPEGQFIPVPFEDFEKSGTYCLIQNDLNNPAYYFDEFDSARSFAVYMDPGTCGQSSYPFKVTDAHFFIYDNPLGFSWPVDIQVNIIVAANGGDKCLGPNPQGTLCSESFTITQDSSFANLGRPMNISLSSPCCVFQPFFLEVKYLDHMSEGDSLPSLLMDAGVPPPDTCDSWVMYEGYYYEWSEFWSLPIPGDAILRATGYAGDEECVDLWYWKPDKPDQDAAAPSGMPDFDQNQDQWVAYCGPVAVANCLWWFDAVPPGWSPPQLIDTLARYFQTNPQDGTDVFLMQEGLQQYFSDYGFGLEETTFEVPDFFEMEDSLKKCQDIILLLGFWFYDQQGEMWYREGGHYVTMAGVHSESLKIAVSDPARDAAETGWPGRVRPLEHPPHPGDPIPHNTPGFVSHDMYQSTLVNPFPSPGNPFWEIDYVWARGKFSGMNVPDKFKEVTRPAPEGSKDLWVTEVEFAVMICPTPSAVGEEEGESVPGDFELLQNYPNPFNNETVIKFSLQKRDQVSLVIYNILGQRVRTLVEGTLQAGPQNVRWDGRDEKGIDLSSGIYFYQLKVGDSKQARRLVLLK